MILTTVIFLIIAGLFSTTLPGANLTGKGRMTGTVKDAATGLPLAGVTIKLFFPTENAYFQPSPVTDAEGKWSVHYIAKGRWDLDFVKEGYELTKISYFVDPTPGAKRVPLDIALKKLEGAAVAQEAMVEIEKAKNLVVEKKFDEAIIALNAAVEKYKGEPGIEIAFLYMGNCYALKNDFKKAIEYYRKTLEKFPNNKEIIISIGNAYNNLEDLENAMVWYKKISIDDLGDIDALYNIGVISYNNGDFDTALKYFKKTTEIDSSFADGFFQMGMTYTGLDKTKEAVEALKKFMELAPDSPNYETAKSIVEAYQQQ